MTTTSDKAAASRKSGAAARREANGSGTVKTKSWRGLVLTLPNDLPGTFAFDLEEIEFSGVSPTAAALHAIRLLVGDEQFALIRKKVTDDGIPMSEMGDELKELAEGIMAVFGSDLGESEASADS